MVKKLLFFVLFIAILGACSQQGGEVKSKTTNISLEDVETVLLDKGFELEKADLPSENVFIQELNSVYPEPNYLEGNPLLVYVFSSANDRGKGIQRFEKITATALLEEHKAYGIDNILVFYVSDDEKIQNELFESLQELEGPE